MYEKVSKGEDPDQRDEGEEPSAKRAKLKAFFSNVPTKYNFQQHIVAGKSDCKDLLTGYFMLLTCQQILCF